MKLRLRSLETKETQKIEVADSCSLQHLRNLVFMRVSSSPSSASASVHLSLNRKDELLDSSPLDSLQSLGITSGDLIFFTLSPFAFLSESESRESNGNPASPNSAEPQKSGEMFTAEADFQKQQTLDQAQFPNNNMKETLGSEIRKGKMKIQTGQTSGHEVVSNVEEEKSFSVPSFLRKVFGKEVGEGGGGDHKLLVIAVHAVLLESGLVGFDTVSKMKVEGFHLPDEWPKFAFTLSLWYTLPEIVDKAVCSETNGVQTIALKFQSLGKYVNVYGSLAEKGSKPYRLCLDEDRLVYFLNFIWANCDSADMMTGTDSFCNLNPEREVFEFWKTVKDGLALPLLIDLCEKAGLPPPPCFMRLPTDLKFKILESLPGVDVAKAGCVCSELNYLSSNDDLWKKKFLEHFGNVGELQGESHWKEKFGKSWESRKKRKTVMSERLIIPRLRGEPLAHWAPRIMRVLGGMGRDHGVGPAVEVLRLRGPEVGLQRNNRGSAFRRPIQAVLLPNGPVPVPVQAVRQRNAVPNCNLGGGRRI